MRINPAAVYVGALVLLVPAFIAGLLAGGDPGRLPGGGWAVIERSRTWVTNHIFSGPTRRGTRFAGAAEYLRAVHRVMRNGWLFAFPVQDSPMKGW